MSRSRRVCVLLPLALLGCGARSSLTPGGDGGSGVAGSAASGGGTGAGGSASCPVASFAGERQGGVRLELDPTHAYWTTAGGLLMRGELASGATETLAELGSASAAIAPAGSLLYFADATRLGRIPKSGGDVEVLAEGPFLPMDIAVRGETVYLLDRGTGLPSGRLLVWDPEGGLVVLLDSLELPRAFAVDETDIYVVAGAVLFGGGLWDAPLLRIGRSGGAAEILETGQREPFGVELDGENVYWGVGLNDAFELNPRLFARPKGRGATRLVATFEPSLPVAFAIDEAYAYVTLPFFPDVRPPHSKLVRAPLSGGEPELLDQRTSEFFTEPAESGRFLAWSVQRHVDDAGDVDDVRVLCKP